MRLEDSEKLLIEEMFLKSVTSGSVKSSDKIEIDKLAGDASTRRYYRIREISNSYVVCLDNPNSEGKSTFLEMQKVYKENGISVPSVYDYNLDRGYILEEDLGDITLLKKLSTVLSEEEEVAIYKESLSELVKIHSIDQRKYSDHEFVSLKFDLEKLMAECQFTVNWFIKKFLKYEISDKENQIILDNFKFICKNLSSPRMVVTHRDFHSRNIMISNGKQVVIDFQDSRLGIPQYDLVSILEDCYYLLPIKTITKLKDFYWENSAFVRNDQSKEEFELNYKLMTIQRVFKAVGSFSYIYGLRGDVRYVKYIGFGMEKLRNVMAELPQLNELRKTLFGIYYEN